VRVEENEGLWVVRKGSGGGKRYRGRGEERVLWGLRGMSKEGIKGGRKRREVVVGGRK